MLYQITIVRKTEAGKKIGTGKTVVFRSIARQAQGYVIVLLFSE